jgi:glutamate/tyrosine decarboxylase-like PLP-dependent enzyme
MLRDLLNLPPSFSGTLVSGATMANFVGLAQGRQWCGETLGVDTSLKGIYNIPLIKVFSAAPHSSIQKTLCMLGMGREALHKVGTLPNREAIDLRALEEELKKLKNPCIVSASLGTVNTGDFDDLEGLASLKEKYSFWLHVDGAFGTFAGVSKTHRNLTKGVEFADSITADGHKWLNVPYDCGVQFTRHNDLQVKVFQNWAAYLTSDVDRASNLINLTPENSRRFRGLPVWVSLIAYGRQGIEDIVERNCALAKELSDKIERHNAFELMAETRLNIVSFTLRNRTRRANQDEM